MLFQAILSGDETDLYDLSTVEHRVGLSVVKTAEGYVLKSDELDGLSEPDIINQRGREIVDLLNGAATVFLRTRRPITVNHLVHINDDGIRSIFVYESGTVTMRATLRTSVVDENGVSKEISMAGSTLNWVAAGLRNATAAHVLHLLKEKQLAWFELYRILEVVESDIGGLDKIIKNGWATNETLRRFKHTANSPAVSGEQSRHGKETTQPPKHPMSLSEGRSMIESILHEWFATK